MEKITIEEIRESTNGIFFNKIENNVVEKIVIDDREVTKNSLFIPIIGETHDGHKFMKTAYNNGCRNFLIDENHKFDKEDINLIIVKNTTIALGNIARYYRNRFNIPFIGITGSVGKTSTKDIIYSVLNKQYKTLKNIGNLNNEIGIPKTLFNLDNTYQAGVLELGMSFKGDIQNFTNIINPSIGVISNIGMSHIENFENQEGIFLAKMEIANKFTKENTLIVNGDDKLLKTLKNKKTEYKLLTYGFSIEDDIYCKEYKINDNKIDFIAIINNKEEKFTIPSVAKHNIYNAMAAILVGLEMNIDIELIKEGLKTFELTKGRLTIINKKDLTIIDDSYNASADSVISALTVLNTYNTRKVAVLGDILETGKYNEEIHRLIGSNVKNNVDILITVGDSSKYIEDEAIKRNFKKENTYHYNNYEDVIKNIKNILLENDTILIKASHGIQLDKVVEYLENEY